MLDRVVVDRRLKRKLVFLLSGEVFSGYHIVAQAGTRTRLPLSHSSCSKKISYSDVASSEEREDGSAQWPELCNVPTRRNFGRTCPRKRNGRTKALNLSICCRRKRSFLGAPPLCSK